MRDRVQQDVDRLGCRDREASRLSAEPLGERSHEPRPLPAEVIVRRARLTDRHAPRGYAGKRSRGGIEGVRRHELHSSPQASAEVGQQPDALREGRNCKEDAVGVGSCDHRGKRLVAARPRIP